MSFFLGLFSASLNTCLCGQLSVFVYIMNCFDYAPGFCSFKNEV